MVSVPAACLVVLVAAFVIDLLTPQLFIAAILLDAPIVLSSLTRSSRFTNGLVVAALAANVVAGYANGVSSHHHWNPLAIGDRILAGLSIVFTGYLSNAVQQNAQRAGRLEAQQSRAEREGQLASAIGRIRSSFSLELVLRAIAREATGLFDADRARFVLVGRPASVTLLARRDRAEVEVDGARPSPQVSSIVQRALDGGEPLMLSHADAIGRLVLDEVDAPCALALPIADADRRFGVVLTLGRAVHSFADVEGLARAFAQQSANALAQAQLFEELGERNEALAGRGNVIRDLVYAISHDLRTPLTALGMTLRQARAEAYGPMPPAYREILDRSIAATDDVIRLAETLLLVARFESGERQPQRERVDVSALTRAIALELDVLARVRDIALHVDGPAEIAIVGDRDDLRRAITNLVANALQHGRAGGTVSVGVHAEGGRAIVQVADDGFGVAPEVRSGLFARFARTGAGGGSGLGLYIVRRVADSLGGQVTYAPREPRGSLFTLSVPMAA